ncbi:MAG TPA: hypothetical protein VGC79_24895 [Polyangiaceae bacterium]
MRGGLIVLMALLLTQGCSSSYEPARSPRITTLVRGGYPTFVKDGQRIGSPAFGTGLVDAVRDNPRAEHHARVGRNLIAAGWVTYLVGLGTGIGGIAVLAHDNTTLSTQQSNVGTALLLTSAATLLAGGVLLLCGQPHIYDAVNIYNDGLEARVPPAPLGPRAH